jgi:hypothetical protein
VGEFVSGVEQNSMLLAADHPFDRLAVCVELSPFRIVPAKQGDSIPT